MIKLHTTCVLGLALLAAPVAAENGETPAGADTATSETAASPFGKAEPVAEQKLAKIAGREDINQVTNADQNNSVSGNDVGDNSVTGQIAVSDQAFSNTNGFVILNANTGNNVAINASIQVNVALPAASVTSQ